MRKQEHSIAFGVGAAVRAAFNSLDYLTGQKIGHTEFANYMELQGYPIALYCPRSIERLLRKCAEKAWRNRVK